MQPTRQTIATRRLPDIPDEVFRLAVEAAPNAMLVVDRSGVIVWANSRAEALFGYTKKELLGKPVHILVPKLLRGEHSRLVGEYFRHPGIRELGVGRDLYGLRKDGTQIPVEIGLTHFAKPPQALAVASIVDITLRVQTAGALKESEQRYMDIVENAPDPIVMLDHLGFVRGVNRAVERVSGYSTGELCGKHFTRINVLDGPSLMLAAKEFALIFAGQERPPAEYAMLMKDGSRRIFEANYRALRQASKMTGLEIILRDISDRKRAEQELKMAYDHLQAAQAGLIQSGKLAALGQMAAQIVHDLRNPLSIAILAVNLLRDPKPLAPQAKQEALAAINEAVTRADRIIRDLLMLSRPAAVNLKPAQPNEVIASALELVKRLQPFNDITVEQSLIAEHVFVMMDARQIQEVFLNLFENALYAMKGAGRLSIKTYLEQANRVTKNVGRRAGDCFRPEERVLVCEVSDTGAGMPQEIVEKIFEPFFSTKPAGEGTGLGLAIVRTIVEAHRGAVSVQSELGRGTSFRVVLPVAAPAA